MSAMHFHRKASAMDGNSFAVIAFGTFVVHELAWVAFNLPYIYFEKVGQSLTSYVPASPDVGQS